MNYTINIQNDLSGEVYIFHNLINAERFLETIMQKQIPITLSYGNKIDTVAQF